MIPAPDKLDNAYFQRMHNLEKNLRQLKTRDEEGKEVPALTKVISLVDGIDAAGAVRRSLLAHLPAEMRVQGMQNAMPHFVAALRTSYTVDEHHRAVPPGQLSDGVLVTNLANRIQPIIRYQMGDRVAIDPHRCSCGSPFPAIDVVGRTDDILTFQTPQGDSIHILPLAIATVAEETPGVTGCQLVQRTPSSLTVRLRAENTEDEQAGMGGSPKTAGGVSS